MGRGTGSTILKGSFWTNSLWQMARSWGKSRWASFGGFRPPKKERCFWGPKIDRRRQVRHFPQQILKQFTKRHQMPAKFDGRFFSPQVVLLGFCDSPLLKDGRLGIFLLIPISLYQFDLKLVVSTKPSIKKGQRPTRFGALKDSWSFHPDPWRIDPIRDYLPAWKLTYPIPQGTSEGDFPFSKVG